MKIIILDSGVDLSHPIFKRIRNVSTGIVIEKNDDQKLGYEIDNTIRDEIGHGTAVTYIIAKNCPEAQVFSLQICKNQNKIDEKKFFEILQMVNNELECDILHLSVSVLGDKYRDELREICNNLYSRGTIIVAAFDNYGRISYPAAFKSVIGVDMTDYAANIKNYFWIENSIVNIRIGMCHQRLPWKNHSMKNVIGNSFTAPYITSMISKTVFEFGMNKEKIKEVLRKNAKDIINYKQMGKKEILNLKKAIIFPYNKEMFNLVRYASSFEITDIYDIKGRGQIGKKVYNIFKKKYYTIKNWNTINWESNFDTIVLGHLRKIESVLECNITDEVLKKAQLYQKNIYAFDKFPDNYYINSRNLYSPYDGYYVENNFGKLYRIKTPLLGICGTGSHQGKFNLQIRLREKLLSLGYRVGWMGTEPTSLLLGADEVFPYGYGANYRDSPEYVIQKTNYLIHNIEMNNPDIIIFGLQSNLIHVSYGNSKFFPSYQYEILAGTDPDAIVLCVSYEDNVDYIERTINYIKIMTRAIPICLVMFPYQKDPLFLNSSSGNRYKQSEITDKKRLLKDKFKISVICLDIEEDLDELCGIIVNFYS